MPNSRYELIKVVGKGGLGQVWLGRDKVLDRDVAVKEVLPLPDPSLSPADMYSRVRREARAAARLRHPALITVHDLFEDDGKPWLVMDFVPGGRSLREELRDYGLLPWQHVADIGRQVADALGNAHAAGVVHRDVKPANILLDEHRVILADFGIARILSDAEITRTGLALGTLPYMAPEQFDGQAVAAADAWALGVTLYAAIEGVLPFRGGSTAELIAAITRARPPRPQKAGPLRDVICELLRKDPAERPACDEVVDRLNEAARKGAPAAKDAAAFMREGRKLRDKKQHAEAEAAYRAAIVLDRGNADAYNDLGHVLRDMRRYPEAVAAYEEARRLAPRNPCYAQNIKVAKREAAGLARDASVASGSTGSFWIISAGSTGDGT